MNNKSPSSIKNKKNKTIPENNQIKVRTNKDSQIQYKHNHKSMNSSPTNIHKNIENISNPFNLDKLTQHQNIDRERCTSNISSLLSHVSNSNSIVKNYSILNTYEDKIMDHTICDLSPFSNKLSEKTKNADGQTTWRILTPNISRTLNG